MIRIAIVEDDESCSQEICQHLHLFGKEYNVPMQIEEYRDGVRIAEQYSGGYDIVLMDIALPGMDGMTAAEKIREADQDVEIIFITNYPQHAIQGYRVGARDYILKPVNYIDFSRTLRKITEQSNKKKRYLWINTRDGKKKLEIQKIRFAEVQDHDLTFHMTDDNITVKGTIRDIMTELQGEAFFRCNKGFLVNLAFVDGVSGYDIQVGADRIMLGRTRKKAFMDAMNLYING